MYSRNARTPWKGIGPPGAAGHSRQLAVNPEARLSEEAGSNVGNVIPAAPTIDKAQLQSAIGNLRVRTGLVDSTSGGCGGVGRRHLTDVGRPHFGLGKHMKIPWLSDRLEHRASNYTEILLDPALRAVTNTLGQVTAKAALESCPGHWARGMAVAKVAPASELAAPLTPAFLAMLGRNLVRRGQALWEIKVVDGRMTLLPIASWNIAGGPIRRRGFTTWKQRAPTPATPEHSQRLPWSIAGSGPIRRHPG